MDTLHPERKVGRETIDRQHLRPIVLALLLERDGLLLLLKNYTR